MGKYPRFGCANGRTPRREREGRVGCHGGFVLCVCMCVRDGVSFGSGGGFNIGIGIEHWEKGLGVFLPCPRPRGSGRTAGGGGGGRGGGESRCGRIQLLSGLVRPFSCCYGCGCVGSSVSGRFVHSGLFPSEKMVGGRTLRCCAEMVAVGSCGSNWVVPALGGRARCILDVKGGRCDQSWQVGMLCDSNSSHPSFLIPASLPPAVSVFHRQIFLALGSSFIFAVVAFQVQRASSSELPD